jgi:hypothetical protein
MPTGLFTISLDLELIWGTLDKRSRQRFEPLCTREREKVIGALLSLFEEFEISATWCVLGHLFLDGCDGRHASIPPPSHRWCRHAWFDLDPASDETRAPLFYGRRLVEKIRRCPVPQEIGSHSFSHVIFGDKGCGPATARAELAACVGSARELGIELRSFAFPRNRIGHLDALREAGFTTYRGLSPRWYDRPDLPCPLRRLGHLWDILTAARPPVVQPELTPQGIWNIPASMLLTPSFGVRRWVPVRMRTRRVCKGLREAARRQRLFHLWFHPTDLAVRSKAMLGGLREILATASTLREQGCLEILPMGAVPAYWAAAEPAERISVAC